MQMISKGFLKKKAEPRETINSSAHFFSEEEKKNIYDYISNFGVCAKDHPHGPKQVLFLKPTSACRAKANLKKAQREIFISKIDMQLPVGSSSYFRCYEGCILMGYISKTPLFKI